MPDEKRVRTTFPKVNHNSPDWPEQQRNLDAMRLRGRNEATARYRKKRAKRLLTAAEEPIRFEAGPPVRQVWKPYRQKKGPHRTYSMTINAIVEMHRSQNGKCAICLIEIAPLGRSRAVDHCHQTGKIRGMLCKACNTGLGMFKDDPKRLIAALAYLGHIDKKFLSMEHLVNTIVKHPIDPPKLK